MRAGGGGLRQGVCRPAQPEADAGGTAAGADAGRRRARALEKGWELPGAPLPGAPSGLDFVGNCAKVSNRQREIFVPAVWKEGCQNDKD